MAYITLLHLFLHFPSVSVTYTTKGSRNYLIQEQCFNSFMDRCIVRCCGPECKSWVPFPKIQITMLNLLIYSLRLSYQWDNSKPWLSAGTQFYNPVHHLPSGCIPPLFNFYWKLFNILSPNLNGQNSLSPTRPAANVFIA